ncbi:hypothetical protein HNQ64_002544 [Prosthecobacter dejongeii]|uniref:Uncharacterized protein n=1 Tax=Prosthecobacter dejongeii TaxID=48465 RepID=A0A7W8DQV9_9BACT|nr:hypothetical protein [Prosthecobacter dejongeii]
MARLSYTHGFDLIFKLLLLGLLFTLFVYTGDFVTYHREDLKPYGITGDWVDLLAVLSSLLLAAGVVYILRRTPLPLVPAFLYVRWSLRTPIRWAEVHQIAFLFVPSQDGTWHTLQHLRKLPQDQRRDALFKLAATLR